VGDAFSAALDALEDAPESPERLYLPFLDVFPVTGVAVSTLGDFLGAETVAASDSTAAHVDELQFDLGEGPCWDAMRLARPVLVPDLPRDGTSEWPAFAQAVAQRDIASLFAFPLMVGPLRFGAVDLYSSKPVTLGATQARQAGALAELVARHVLTRALVRAEGGPSSVETPHSRRLVHQATGMVLAQLNISATDALLVIQGHAYASERSMMEVARDIVERRLDFSAHGDEGGGPG
jgi:GAF domain-containing protein